MLGEFCTKRIKISHEKLRTLISGAQIVHFYNNFVTVLGKQKWTEELF
jgi:hypothetical protein